MVPFGFQDHFGIRGQAGNKEPGQHFDFVVFAQTFTNNLG
jgi:hypothetical protein